MTIVDDTRKSLYAILAKRVKEGNASFQVSTSTGCRDSRNRGAKVASEFQKWANDQASNLMRSVPETANIIPVDDSILSGFPPPRPARCATLASIRIMLDKDGYQTYDPSKNVLRSSDGNVTHDWTRSYWFKGKKRDFGIYKAKIDKYIEEYKKQFEFDKQQLSLITNFELSKQKEKEKSVLFSLLLPIAGILLLYSRGDKS